MAWGNEIAPNVAEAGPPRPWVTWFIIGSTVAVFLGQLAIQHQTGVDQLGNTLAFSSQAWAEGRYWTLLTYAWAHSTSLFDDPQLFWLHLVANMAPVFFLGPLLEGALGHWRYALLYVGGALVSGLGWWWFAAGPDDAIIGASGAVFALIAAVGTLAPRLRVRVLLFFIIPIRTTLGIGAACICAAELVQMIFGWMSGIAHSAHLVGAGFGCLFILILRWVKSGKLKAES